MEIDDPLIEKLKSIVSAAYEEFDLGIAFFEVWKPMAYDEALHQRMGRSYATQGFRIIHTALRRELLFALIRLWDTNKQAVRMTLIKEIIENPQVIDALAEDRAKNMHLQDVVGFVRDDLGAKAGEVSQQIGEYMEGGSKHYLWIKLNHLRHERLAHRQVAEAVPARHTTTDDEIQMFFLDNAKIIETLLSLVKAIAYESQDTRSVYGFYAKEFWKRIGSQEFGSPISSKNAKQS
jgi:hypothetical protein